MKFKAKKILIATVLLLSLAVPAFADFVFCGKTEQLKEVSGKLEGQCTLANLWELVFVAVNFLIGMAGLVSLALIVWGGLRMMLSGGNPEAIKDGKSTIWNAILGLIIVFVSYITVGYIARLLLPGSSDPLKGLIDFIR